jgi:RimJ/RimL family protein N-acetyltransferase
MSEFLFYRAFSRPGRPQALADPGYSCELWKPSLGALTPSGLPLLPFGVWWLFHHFKVFSNRGYALFLIRRRGEVVHRSVVTPGYLRFPFMRKGDLQVGDTLTEPGERGKGLAVFALRAILSSDDLTDRPYWYVVERDNAASIRAAEKAGFQLAGEGTRTKRLGLRALGSYVIRKEVG